MFSTTHHEVRALADQLVTEYAGAISPGQVEAVVLEQAHGLARLPHLSAAERMRVCEWSARRALTDRLAGLGRVSSSG